MSGTDYAPARVSGAPHQLEGDQRSRSYYWENGLPLAGEITSLGQTLVSPLLSEAFCFQLPPQSADVMSHRMADGPGGHYDGRDVHHDPPPGYGRGGGMPGGMQGTGGYGAARPHNPPHDTGGGYGGYGGAPHPYHQYSMPASQSQPVLMSYGPGGPQFGPGGGPYPPPRMADMGGYSPRDGGMPPMMSDMHDQHHYMPYDGGRGERRPREDRYNDGYEDSDTRALKRPRLVWTPQLHKRFVDAVSHVGIQNAVPKTIMQLMNVEGLTRENVASHLQKYRLYVKRVQNVDEENGSGDPSMKSKEGDDEGDDGEVGGKRKKGDEGSSGPAGRDEVFGLMPYREVDPPTSSGGKSDGGSGKNGEIGTGVGIEGKKGSSAAEVEVDG